MEKTAYEQALDIVFSLAEQNALDLDDPEMGEEAKRQHDALKLVSRGPDIVVNVSGGCVQSVMSNLSTVGVELRDWDNIYDEGEDDEEGNFTTPTDPMAEFVTDQSSSMKYASDVDWDKAGYPHEVF